MAHRLLLRSGLLPMRSKLPLRWLVLNGRLQFGMRCGVEMLGGVEMRRGVEMCRGLRLWGPGKVSWRFGGCERILLYVVLPERWALELRRRRFTQ